MLGWDLPHLEHIPFGRMSFAELGLLPDGVADLIAAAADFAEAVLPILRANCLPCHQGEKTQAGLDLSTAALSKVRLCAGFRPRKSSPAL